MTKRRIALAVADATESSELARILRDGGHEVVLIGGRHTPEQLISTVIAEDAVELVIDDHLPEVSAALQAQGVEGVRVTVARDLVV